MPSAVPSCDGQSAYKVTYLPIAVTVRAEDQLSACSSTDNRHTPCYTVFSFQTKKSHAATNTPCETANINASLAIIPSQHITLVIL